jgi:BarA-like signal transduction histidine kinase
MSAQEQQILERIAAAAHITYCLSKPLLPNELIPLLKKVAQLKRTEQEAA